jgi:hypothetical protein
MSHNGNIKKNLYASCVATATAELATLPICTIKTNYQNTNSNSISATIKDIYNKNGFKGFYKASFPAIGSQMISTSSKYVFYRYLEDLKLENSNKFFNGVIAGLTSTIITHPLDSVRIHQQMQKSFTNKLKREGLKLFYRGYSKTFSKILVSSALFFPLYDYYLSYFKNNYRNSDTKNYLWAGFSSSVTATCIMHPIDYLKTRHIYGQSLYNGFNPINYYRGLTLNLLRIVPHFMITMTLISSLSNQPT